MIFPARSSKSWQSWPNRRPSHDSYSSEIRSEGRSPLRIQGRSIPLSSRSGDAGDRHHTSNARTHTSTKPCRTNRIVLARVLISQTQCRGEYTSQLRDLSSDPVDLSHVPERCRFRLISLQRSHDADPREHRWPPCSATRSKARIVACLLLTPCLRTKREEKSIGYLRLWNHRSGPLADGVIGASLKVSQLRPTLASARSRGH